MALNSNDFPTYTKKRVIKKKKKVQCTCEIAMQ